MRKLFFLLLIIICLAPLSPAFPAQEATRSENSSGISKLLEFNEPLYFEIIVQDCKLIAYKKKSDDTLEKISEFPIATVREGIYLYPIGKGFITKVELNPFWYPTPDIVEYMNKKLIAQGKKPTFSEGMRIGPKDPRNAMGTFKMFLSQSAPEKGSIYRIHGTNMPKSIGKRASRGCIRMKNETGFPIAQNVKDRMKRGQRIEVHIMMTREG